MLTQERLKELLHYDPETGLFTWIVRKASTAQIGAKPGSYDAYGYRLIRVDGKLYKSHRLAFLYMTGEMPPIVDHINMIRDDNRFSNLRAVDNTRNLWNTKRPKSNTSGIKGVSLCKATGRWVAQIKAGSKSVWCGRHDTPEQAEAAVREARERIHGEYANHG